MRKNNLKAIAFKVCLLCAGSAAVGRDAASVHYLPAVLAADCTAMEDRVTHQRVCGRF